MAAKFALSGLPAAFMVAIIGLRLLSLTAAYAPIPANSSELDHWMSSNRKTNKERAAEIAGGINTTIEPRIMQSESRTRVITVRQDGTGNFRTIMEAVNSIPMQNSVRTIVRIGPGVYWEKVTVDRMKPYVTFYGEPGSPPTISFNGTAAKYGTWQSATVAVESHYFIACNIIFENTAPRPVAGVKGAQAVAMRISGDKAAFYNCKFYGYQDTLLDDQGKHFFKDCFIRGTIDFIFGNGRSIYLNCEVHSVADGATAITAQGRETIAGKSGFSFVHCNITGTGDAYLGRAWRQSSRVVFAYTYMGSLINPKGWDDKGFVERQRTVFYGEYKCFGPGAATHRRASFGQLLTDEQAKPFVSMTFIRAAKWLLPPPKL